MVVGQLGWGAGAVVVLGMVIRLPWSIALVEVADDGQSAGHAEGLVTMEGTGIIAHRRGGGRSVG